MCGATGFIGRNIVESLIKRDDFELFGTHLNSKPLDIPGIKMLRFNLTDKNDVNRAVKGMDVIIQTAATTSGAKDSVTRPYYHVTDNAIMNSLIFKAAHEYKVSHVVFFSCTIMYQSSDRPLKETDFDANQEIYPNYFGAGWTKVYIEKMCEFYSRLGHSKYTVIRHSNIYGPYDKFNLEKSHVFGATMTKVMSTNDGGKVVIWGSGNEERDLLYISDLVNFVKLVVDKQSTKFELYNAGCGYSISVKSLVDKMISCSGKNLKIEHDFSKPSIKTKLCLNTVKAKEDLRWVPTVSLEEGIQKTMTWYRANIRRVEPLLSVKEANKS